MTGQAQRRCFLTYALRLFYAVATNGVTQGDAGFDAETNRVLSVTAHGTGVRPLLSRQEVAARIYGKVVKG